MRKHIDILAAVCLLAFIAGSGCKNPAVTRTVVSTLVSTGVAVGVSQKPDAVPYLRAATPIVCASAANTNLNPAAVVAAIQSGTDPKLKTLSGVLLLNGALAIYTALWEQGAVDGLTDQVILQAWLWGVCDGLTLGLPLVGTARPAASWHPHIVE